MPKTRMIQVRVPEHFLKRIDYLIEKGLYRSRSEVILDATRRFLEKSMPPSYLESFIEKYLAGKVARTTEAKERIDKLFEKMRMDTAWKKRFGETPEEIMDRLRRRLT